MNCNWNGNGVCHPFCVDSCVNTGSGSETKVVIKVKAMVKLKSESYSKIRSGCMLINITSLLIFISAT